MSSDTDINREVYETTFKGPSGESKDGAESQRQGGHDWPSIEELLTARDVHTGTTSSSTPSPPSAMNNKILGVEE